MADVAVAPWLTAVTALATPFIGAFLPRLWQGDLRRMQSVAETRVKRLEAVEKALSVTAAAKVALGIDTTTHDIQSELQQIVHEFAGPTVLSREELEEWISKPLATRLARFPIFTRPEIQARAFQYFRYFGIISFICGVLSALVLPLLVAIFPKSLEWVDSIIQFLQTKYAIPEAVAFPIVLLLIPTYFLILYYVSMFRKYQTAVRALRELRAMPEIRVGEEIPVNPHNALAAGDGEGPLPPM